MINFQWLELPMSRTIFYGPKDVRAIEIRLYISNVHSSRDSDSDLFVYLRNGITGLPACVCVYLFIFIYLFIYYLFYFFSWF